MLIIKQSVEFLIIKKPKARKLIEGEVTSLTYLIHVSAEMLGSRSQSPDKYGGSECVKRHMHFHENHL